MISKFVKTSTSAWDENISSVVFVSEDGDVDENDVFEYVENRTVDCVIIDGDEPAHFVETVALAKRFKKSKLKVNIVTKGRCPDGLDNLIGACYVDSVKICFDFPIDANMKKTIDIIFDSGIEHEFSVNLDKNKLSEDDIMAILRSIKGAKRLSLTIPNAKSFTKSEIAKFCSDAKNYVKNVKIINV